MCHKHFLSILDSDLNSFQGDTHGLKTLYDRDAVKYMSKFSKEKDLSLSEIQTIQQAIKVSPNSFEFEREVAKNCMEQALKKVFKPC